MLIVCPVITRISLILKDHVRFVSFPHVFYLSSLLSNFVRYIFQFFVTFTRTRYEVYGPKSGAVPHVQNHGRTPPFPTIFISAYVFMRRRARKSAYRLPASEGDQHAGQKSAFHDDMSETGRVYGIVTPLGLNSQPINSDFCNYF